MIETLIERCARNRFLVFAVVLLATLAGVYSLRHIPLDAIPDISDVQVIVYTPWEGRSPDLVEDQVTYPIVTALLSAPRVKTVRGLSDFGYSYVYAIFEDGTDIYWARSRVLEYLQQIARRLPEGASPALGPDASGVGWVFTYALVDESGRRDLGELRALQDWHLRYALASVPGVAEVASVGGFVRQYQVNVDPQRLSAYGISIREVMERIRLSNRDVEGRVLEMGGREYMVRGRGYLRGVEDLRRIVVASRGGTPVLLGDVAQVALGPDIRRGLVELDGRGEGVGGIVIMRHGENALRVIDAVKEKITEIAPGLPEGVRIVPTYDRSELILLAIGTLQKTLLTEIAAVSWVVILFLFHVRSALVPILALPVAVAVSFIPMMLLGIPSNIMSLGGIALSIGVLVDAAIVMVENGVRRLAEEGGTGSRRETLVRSCRQVGRGLFFALLIILVSFAPVFLLEAQEGRLFRPLAFTKTFAMAAATILAVTLVPVLMTVFLARGRVRPEAENPVSRFLHRVYEPILRLALRRRKTALFLNALLIPLSIGLGLRAGSEFMPPLYEGTIFYMPVTAPGISVTEAGRLLTLQDRILKSFPEVERVFGKAGRAETATDPAPLSMMETTVLLKPRHEWRRVRRDFASWPSALRPLAAFLLGEERALPYEELVAEMDRAMRFPGVQNSWTMPIRARIDMLSTGIRTPVGVKVFGPDPKTVEEIGLRIEAVLQDLPGTRSVFAERAAGGYFVDIDIRREAIARYGLTVAEVQEVIQSAIGGMNLTRTVEGRARFPVNLRYPRELRDDLERIERVLVPVPPPDGRTMEPAGRPPAQIPLAQLADIGVSSGPAMIRNEDGLLAGYVFIDVVGRDLGGYVEEARRVVREQVALPPGTYLSWSGQYEFQLRARERLQILVPVVFFVILILLYLAFRSFSESLILMVAVLYAMTGGVILQVLLGYNFSVAVWVGYIALYGIAVETGVVMVLYLHEALDRRLQKGAVAPQDILDATLEGSVLRLRPKVMTVATTLIGLLPILGSSGVGADVMKPIAAPIVGGLVTSTLHVLIVTPVIFAMVKERALRRGRLAPSVAASAGGAPSPDPPKEEHP
ncbi:MAG: CusA/CzcA family heavy metal efflux RND transporter [Desulfobacterales bacterium]